jgi:hypothetical protein
VEFLQRPLNYLRHVSSRRGRRDRAAQSPRSILG